MRTLIAVAASLLLAACAAVNGAPGGADEIYLLPPAQPIERVRTTELAALPERGPAVPARRER